LPAVLAADLEDSSMRSWLVRSDLSRDTQNDELLARITRATSLPYPQEGLGALRFWGQTGERPTTWMAAADPVYLEPRLDFLWLHTLAEDEISTADLGVLVDHLQRTLGEDQRSGFTLLGAYSSLRTNETMATADVSSAVVDQCNPGDYLPNGPASAPYRNLLSEIEMALHEHEINQRRSAAGQQPVNSLWIWGGGAAPPVVSRQQPPLFANDPLLLGYWASASAPASSWPGDIASCLDAASDGFVAVVPPHQHGAESLLDILARLRRALRTGRVSQLTLLFGDGLQANIRRSHVYRLWRRDRTLLATVARQPAAP
jgi:hypothetical protein